MPYRFYTADVFTDQRFGGNPLAVFPDARGLGPEQMQRIAREMSLSETVFVLPAREIEHTRRLRIFTPRIELPFAGHPTIGSAFVLAAVGDLTIHGEVVDLVFEENVGPVPVALRTEAGRPTSARLTSAQRPEVGPEPPGREQVAEMLSLEADDLLDGLHFPEAVSCGVPFLFVPVRHRDALGRARLRLERWEAILASFWAPDVYVFTFDTELPGSHVRARMFGPSMGITEDPATGAAATALGGYLGRREDEAGGRFHWVVEQGHEMGRPSRIDVEAEKKAGEVERIHVGGACVLVSEGLMHAA